MLYLRFYFHLFTSSDFTMACRIVRPVKSGPSRRACYLRFINRTTRRVNLFWIDYGGYGVNYGTLEPDRHFDIHTYEGHPWMAADSALRTTLLLNNSKIFYPSAVDHDNANVQPNREFRNYLPLLINQGNPNNQNEVHQMRREIVLITIPGQLYMFT